MKESARFQTHLAAALLLSAPLLGSGCSQCNSNPITPAAQVRLGNRYSSGNWLPKDDEKAAFWYRKAAMQGDAAGQFQLGLCYETGIGLPKNEAEAVVWYRKAALQGDSNAQYRLGLAYHLQEGVPKNNVLAYQWLNIAAASGNRDARAERDALAYKMTDREISAAQRLSRDWKPQ